MKGFLRTGAVILTLSIHLYAQAVITIPFKLDESALPIIEVNINGRDGEFMLDSGSQFAFHFTHEFMRQVPNLKY